MSLLLMCIFLADQSEWSGECSGSMQSPINIDVDSTVINQTLDLAFKNYDIPLMSFSVVNNGHSGTTVLVCPFGSI